MSYGDILKAVAKATGVELRAHEAPEALAEAALDEGKAAAIAKAAREEAVTSPVVSTATCFADGSLTDRVSWVKMVERVP